MRHQIGVLPRSVRKRPKLSSGDRFFWVYLSRIWSGWRSALVIVKPETVVAWHRKGFRLFWTWKVGKAIPVDSIVSHEVRPLIRRMCRENPTWGAPRIHGELLKLGIDIGETSLTRYPAARGQLRGDAWFGQATCFLFPLRKRRHQEPHHHQCFHEEGATQVVGGQILCQRW